MTNGLPSAVMAQCLLHRCIPFRHRQQCAAFPVPDRGDVSSGCDESRHDGLVLRAWRPAMYGSKRGPSKGRALMSGIPGVERHATPGQEVFNHAHIAHPAGRVQRCPAVDTGGGRIEPQTEHEVGRGEALVEDRVGQVPMLLGCERG
jgi:hypothetical protein